MQFCITADRNEERSAGGCGYRMTVMAIAALALIVLQAAGSQTPTLGTADVGPQFQQYTTLDRFDRTVTFYISRDGSESREVKGDSVPKSDARYAIRDRETGKGGERPLALLILGSGGQSVWQKRDGKVGGGLQNVLLECLGDQFRVLVVEKPGVELFFQPKRPGSAMGCSKPFLQEHTLERWAEANLAAVKACQSLPAIRKGGVLAIGHSEGGIVAAKIAALDKIVSHVAVLSGGGPNQLEDLKVLMGKGVEAEWKRIQADPDSIEEFAWGHPYLRWSSFLASSTIEELLKSKAQVFMAAGTEDKSVPISSFDTAVKTLTEKGRKVESLRIEGGDHGFRKPSDKSPIAGFERVFVKVAAWFLSRAR